MPNIIDSFWVIRLPDGELIMGNNSQTKGFYNSQKIAESVLKGQIKLLSKLVKISDRHQQRLDSLNSATVKQVKIVEQ